MIDIAYIKEKETQLMEFEDLEQSLREVYMSQNYSGEIFSARELNHYHNLCRHLFTDSTEFINSNSFLADQPDILSLTFGAQKRKISLMKHPRYFPCLPHIHEYIELFYVVNGSCIHFCDNSQYRLKKGDLCMFQRRASHTLSGYSDDLIILNVLIDQNAFEEAFFSLLQSDSLVSDYFNRILNEEESFTQVIFQTQDDLFIRELFFRMYDENNAPGPYTFYQLSNYLNQVFIHLLQNYTDHVVSINKSSTSVPMLKIYYKIQESFQSISLEELSQQFGYSPAHLSKLIKESFGVSFREIVAQKKTKEAAQQLLTTDKSVAEIAQNIGCSDTSHFIRLFKKYFHTTPYAFRKKARV